MTYQGQGTRVVRAREGAAASLGFLPAILEDVHIQSKGTRMIRVRTQGLSGPEWAPLLPLVSFQGMASMCYWQLSSFDGVALPLCFVNHYRSRQSSGCQLSGQAARTSCLSFKCCLGLDTGNCLIIMLTPSLIAF